MQWRLSGEEQLLEAGHSLAIDHADTKSNMQDLQPLVMDMGIAQQASGSDLDKVLSSDGDVCMSLSEKGRSLHTC